MIFHVLLAVCVFGSIVARVPPMRRCSSYETLPDFNISKYLGRWYEAERSPVFFEAYTKCATVDYISGENGTVEVINAQITIIPGKPPLVKSVAHIPDSSDPAKMKMIFPQLYFPIENNYWILGTDYESYAVVFGCADSSRMNFKFTWVLTRDRNPSQSVIDKAMEIVDKNKIDRSLFSKTNQTNCEIESSE